MIQTHQSTSDTKQAEGDHANQSVGEYALPEGVIYAPQSSNDKILSLQQTVGNQAVVQMMRQGTIKPAKSKPSSFNPRSFAMASPATTSPSSIQRRLKTTSADLTGKQARTGVVDEKKDNAALSTFRAIEKALDKYHQTGDEDFDNQAKFLKTIIDKCRAWLGDKSHKKAKDQEKRNSLSKLEVDAQYEYRRVIITKEIGVPRQMVDGFDLGTIDEFWLVVVNFDTKNVKGAMDAFKNVKGKLGDGAGLIESFMKRNQIEKIDPKLAAIMGGSSVKSSKAEKQDAINLIKAQAQAKLARLTDLHGQYAEAEMKMQADMKKPDNQRTLKQTDFPILTQGNLLNMEYTMLKMQKEHYKGLADGTAIKDKKKNKLFKDFKDTELTGLMGYTSNLYGAINSPLRSDVGDSSKFTGGHRALAGSITSALHKLKPYAGQVYRHGGDFPGYATVNIPGAIVSDMAPLSTAKSASGPASAGEMHEVLEILISKTGRDVSEASLFTTGEDEILFAPGTRFRVVATFQRERASWNTPHKSYQWSPTDHPKFKQAMEIVDKDTKKNSFHRVVYKEEV